MERDPHRDMLKNLSHLALKNLYIEPALKKEDPDENYVEKNFINDLSKQQWDESHYEGGFGRIIS